MRKVIVQVSVPVEIQVPETAEEFKNLGFDHTSVVQFASCEYERIEHNKQRDYLRRVFTPKEKRG